MENDGRIIKVTQAKEWYYSGNKEDLIRASQLINLENYIG